METINQVTKKCFCNITKFLPILLLFVFTDVATAQVYFDNGFEGGEGIDWSSNGPFRPVPAFVSSSSISREGDKSVHFVPDKSGKRSEFTLLSNGVFNWGEEYWIGTSFMFLTKFDGYGSFFQHHGTASDGHDLSGPSGITFTARGDNIAVWTTTRAENVHKKMKSKGGSLTGTQRVYNKPYVLNKWYDLVIHFRYALDQTGFYEVWLNGEKIVNLHNTPTAYKYELYHPSVVGPKTEAEVRAAKPIYYQKIGNYHGPARKGEILYDAFRIGKGSSVTYEDVAPAGGTLAVEDDKLEKMGFQIYPNPTANEINIQFSENQNVENISIYDVLGKEVFTKKIESSESKVILHPNLSKGIYFLKMNSNKGKFNKKVIIK